MIILNSIKHIKIIQYCFFSIFLSLLSCEKTTTIDNSNGTLIELKTLDAKIVSESEIHFTGNISSINKEDILDVGFILYDLSADPKNPIEISLGKEAAKVGSIAYVYKPKFDFVVGQTYGFDLYVKTKKAFYKGGQSTFVVDLIKIDDDQVRYSKIGQKTTIKGDFTQLNDSYLISFESESNETAALEISQNKSEMSFVIPPINKNHGQSLEIYLLHKKENGLNQYKRKLLMVELVGTINKPEPNTYYYNDALPIAGIGIEKPIDGTLKVVMNGKSKNYHPGLGFADFGPFKGSDIKWAIDYGNEVVEFAEPLKLKVPTLSHHSFEQNGYHTYGTIYIDHFDIYKYYGTSIPEIRLGSHKIVNAHFQQQSLFFELKNIPEGQYTLEIVSPMYTIKSNTMITIKNLVLNPLQQKEAYPKDEMTLTGSFIPGYWYVLSLAHSVEAYQAKSATELDIKIPSVTPGTYKLKLEDVPEQDIKILEPRFTNVNPAVVSVGENMTIKGKGLNDVNMVLLNNYVIYPTHIDGETLQIKPPFTILPGKYKLTLQFSYDNKYVDTNQYIEIL